VTGIILVAAKPRYETIASGFNDSPQLMAEILVHTRADSRLCIPRLEFRDEQNSLGWSPLLPPSRRDSV